MHAWCSNTTGGRPTGRKANGSERGTEGGGARGGEGGAKIAAVPYDVSMASARLCCGSFVWYPVRARPRSYPGGCVGMCVNKASVCVCVTVCARPHSAQCVLVQWDLVHVVRQRCYLCIFLTNATHTYTHSALHFQLPERFIMQLSIWLLPPANSHIHSCSSRSNMMQSPQDGLLGLGTT